MWQMIQIIGIWITAIATTICALCLIYIVIYLIREHYYNIKAEKAWQKMHNEENKQN